MERITRRQTDVVIFICVLLAGIIIIIFWNRIVGTIISISSLIPIHKEVINLFKLLISSEDKNDKKTVQHIKNSNGAMQVIAHEDSVVNITHNSTSKNMKKKR
jgi:hypothetical protein